MKKNRKKLSLSRKTVRILRRPEALKKVAAGTETGPAGHSNHAYCSVVRACWDH